MSSNFTIFSYTKHIRIKIQLKYPTIFTFYVLYGIFEQIYRHIASNTMNFTYCADKVEKILLVVAQFHYLFIFQRIIDRSRKVLLDDCYLIIRVFLRVFFDYAENSFDYFFTDLDYEILQINFSKCFKQKYSLFRMFHDNAPPESAWLV